MKIIRVTYKVKPEFVETNKSNIANVMASLRALNNPNIKYSSFLEEDGQTFMHFAMYPDEETARIIGGIEPFVKFRTELKASQPEIPPKASDLSLVDSAYDIFKL